MFFHHLKIALRSLRSNMLFTGINILGLSIGLGAVLLIFTWVQNELSFDSYHPYAKDTYRVISILDPQDDPWYFGSIPYPLAQKVSSIPEIEKITLGRIRKNKLIQFPNKKKIRGESIAFIDSQWFKVFDYPIIDGSTKDFAQNRYSIGLSQDIAQLYFGEENPIGKQIQIDSTLYTVNLIVGTNPSNSVLQFKIFIPVESLWASPYEREKLTEWGEFEYKAFVVGKAPERIAQKFTQILHENQEDDDTLVQLEPLGEIRFNLLTDSDYFPHQKKSAVLIFGIIGALLLLIASFNTINLSTSIIHKRTKEIGVKKVLGASFYHIFIQIILETLITTCLSLLLAGWITELFMPVLNSFIDLPLEFSWLSLATWRIILGGIIFNVFIAGLYPAFLFAGFKPLRLMKQSHTPQQGLSIRRGLVVTQFSISLIVLICTLVLHQQFQLIQKKDVGYDRSQVVIFEPNLFQEDFQKNFQNFATWKQEMEQIPEFTHLTATDNSIVDVQSFGGNLSWAEKYTATDLPNSMYKLKTNEALQALFDLKLIQGRWFSKENSQDKFNIIFNETAVKRFQIHEPIIGKKVQWGSSDGQIIGVVKDFHFQSLHKEIEPLVLFQAEDDRYSTLMARIEGSAASDGLKKAQSAFEEALPGIDFHYSFLDETYTRLYESEAKFRTLIQLFAGLLIFIACLGLFGLSIFAVQRRTKEIGIRKVLGARVGQIIQLLSSDFLKLVGMALVFASPIAWVLMNNWLETFAYRVSLSWWIFVLAGLLAIVLAFLTVGTQSFRAAIANPVKALRSE